MKTRNTLLFAVLLLFFIQLFGMWIESIYRLSLTRLAPGKELYGILLLLLPLVVFTVGEKWERGFLWGAMLVFLAARLLCPQVGALGQIIVGGVGVAMFLIILSYAFSARYHTLQGDLGQAFGIAVLLSIMFRSWGSSADVSMEGATGVLGWGLALLALHQFRAAMATFGVAPPPVKHANSCRPLAMLGLFANLTMASLVLANPLVVCAWTGYARVASSGVIAVALIALPFAAVLLLARRAAAPRPLLTGLWNLLFLALLVGGLFFGRPALPMSAETPPLFVYGHTPTVSDLLYLALLFAPVVIFNVRHIARFTPCARPRSAILPVMMGMGLLLALALLLLLTNVWGYVPFGRLLRNCFYLPFLIAGVGMLAPWLLRPPRESAYTPAHGRLAGYMAIGLAVLAVAGALIHIPRLKPAAPKRELTIMTYNMQQGSRVNGDRNYREQLDLLRRINPDIIGLQESDTARPSGGYVDAVRYFADALGYHAYYGPGSIAGTFGAAILSRYPIKNPRTFYTYSDSDEVGTAAAEIEVGGTTIAFFSNHPSGAAKVMNAHVQALMAEAGKYPHAIAVGDYNFTPREPYYASLSQVLQDSATQLVVNNINDHEKNPNHADEIDHIFLSHNFRVLENNYLPPPDSQTDHPARWSRVVIE